MSGRHMLSLILGGVALAALVTAAFWNSLAALIALCIAVLAAIVTRLLTFPAAHEMGATDVAPVALPTSRGGEDKQAKAEAITPTALLEATMNSMREGVLIVNAEMSIISSNAAARDIFEGFEGKLESRRLSELTRNPSIHEAFRAALAEEKRAEAKVEMRRGEKRIFDLRVAPLRFGSLGGTRGAIGVFFDITQLERLERVRQEFLSNVSHELRTPLTAIIAFVETLEDGALEDVENNQRFLQVIRRNAERMHHLLDDILELSSIEAGIVTVEPRTVRAANVVEDIITALAARASARQVTFRNEIASEVLVYADARRLEQMLTNLADNAVKFSREGGHIIIRHEELNGRDRISVEDTGDGISSDHIERIFERFYRVDRARSREMGGTGLGLAIVKHLARAHGGEALVHSTPGQGSIFTIELPKEVMSDE